MRYARAEPYRVPTGDKSASMAVYRGFMQGGTSQRRDRSQEKNHSQDLIFFFVFLFSFYLWLNLKKSAFVFNQTPEKDGGLCGAADCLETFVKGFPSISCTNGSAGGGTPLHQTAWLDFLSYIQTPL